MQITAIGLDLAKNVFQVHGVDAEGRVVVRRKLRLAKVREFFAGLAPCTIWHLDAREQGESTPSKPQTRGFVAQQPPTYRRHVTRNAAAKQN